MMRKNTGFTLLEIMLVLVLIGLASSMIVPRISSGSSSQNLQQMILRLQAQSQIAQQHALLAGQQLGLQFYQSAKEQGYQFLLWQNGQWAPLTRHRLLKTYPLAQDLQYQIKPGSSFWAPLLAQQNKNNRLAFSRKTEKNKAKKPQIIFYNSGEITPATIELCLKRQKQQCRQLQLAESGEIHVG